MKMKKYIKPSTEIQSAYIETSIMTDSTTNDSSLIIIDGEGQPKVENSWEILTPECHLWDEEGEQ